MNLLREYIEQELMIPSTAPRTSPKQARMDALMAEYSQSLGASEARVVWGTGNLNAELMLIGEAPGEEEDRQRLPFVGRSGQLLTKMLASIEIQRGEIYITNLLKCRPPENRNPTPVEIEVCRPFLARQIAIIQPKVIAALGSFAARSLLQFDKKTVISKVRGQIFSYEGIPCIPTFHPAYLLRNPSAKKEAWEDWKKIKSLLET